MIKYKNSYMKNSDENNLKEIKKINKELDKYRPYYKMFIRLSVVKLVKEGMSRGEAADTFNVHRKSAENWVKIYNNEGLSGLIPDYSNCGVKSKLSDEQLDELKNIILDSEKDYDINMVREVIRERFNVNYSYKQTWVTIKEKLCLNYDKNKITL